MAVVDNKSSEKVTRLETQIQARFGSQVRHLRVVSRNNGVILQGRARTYHVKHLAEHSVMEMTDLPILANDIEVF